MREGELNKKLEELGREEVRRKLKNGHFGEATSISHDQVSDWLRYEDEKEEAEKAARSEEREEESLRIAREAQRRERKARRQSKWNLSIAIVAVLITILVSRQEIWSFIEGIYEYIQP